MNDFEAKIEKRLLFEPGIFTNNYSVDVVNCNVYVMGISSDIEEKTKVENFLNNSDGIKSEKNDIRFMDPFDHVMTSLINQAEDDKNFGIPFEDGPVALRYYAQKVNLGNNWYKDAF